MLGALVGAGSAAAHAVLISTDPGHPGVEVSAPVSRFSSIAAGSVVILIGTGSYQPWRQLGSWGAFGSTSYANSAPP